MADQKGEGIAWTEQTWNPIRGCSRVSEGCRFCYAEVVAARFSGPGMPYAGLAKRTEAGPRWTGDVKLIEDHLEDPVRWQRPRRIFVNSMSDIFHEKLSNHAIARVFNSMARAPRHTYQVLTKRADRMAPFFGSASARLHFFGAMPIHESQFPIPEIVGQVDDEMVGVVPKNIWIGISAEDQKALDTRLPELLRVPARTRWLSIEPQIGPITLNLERYVSDVVHVGSTRMGRLKDFLDWVVIGGESGPNARVFDIGWARSLIAECKAAGVAVFMKQLGTMANAAALANGFTYSGKGGDPDEWPKDLRVRQYPEAA